ncbi:MAG: GNAT family N-acetyltransferase [Acidimicrobiia bacterium]
MTIRLETERMLLREFTTEDSQLLFELNNDPEVMFYINAGQPVPMAEIVEETLPAFVAYYRDGDRFGFWAANEKATGTFLGWFHLHRGERSTDPELGYRLHRAAWNRGLATEGCAALIERAFQDPTISRIYAETMVVHTASRRVMEKVGMRFVRIFHADWPFRIPGDEHGDVEYEITRAEWGNR